MEHTFPQHVDQHGAGHYFPAPAPVSDPAAALDPEHVRALRAAPADYVPPAVSPSYAVAARGLAEAVAQPQEGPITRRVALPSGGWAELGDPKQIRAKHRKRVMDAMNADRIKDGKAGVAMDMTEGLMLMMVERWEIPYFPGVVRPLDQPSCLDELMLPDYDAIADHLDEARRLLFPAPASVDNTKPGSPTLPVGA